MRLVPAVAALLALLALAGPAGAQGGVRTPPPGSPERAAILDAARAAVHEQLRQPVRFRVDHLRVRGGWAFLQATPQRPDGRPPDYRGTPYQEAMDAGAFDDQATALLRREGAAWRVVAFNLGATDVVWEPWAREFGCPAGDLSVVGRVRGRVRECETATATPSPSPQGGGEHDTAAVRVVSVEIPLPGTGEGGEP